MKRLFNFLPLLIAGLFAVTVVSCSDDDKTITDSQLPSNAKVFISTYFPNVDILAAKKSGSEYEVTLKNGSKIDFTKDGEWKDVEAPTGQAIPSGFYPASIDSYISTNFATSGGINEISVNKRGYDVDLVSRVELNFDKTGEFIGIDK